MLTHSRSSLDTLRIPASGGGGGMIRVLGQLPSIALSSMDGPVSNLHNHQLCAFMISKHPHIPEGLIITAKINSL